jgi:hypothetical protein
MLQKSKQHVRLAPLGSKVNVGQKHGLNIDDVTIFLCQDGRPYKIGCFQMDDSIVILMTAALNWWLNAGATISPGSNLRFHG